MPKFDLRIGVTGLSLLAQDLRKGKERVHVLMPPTNKPHAGHDAHPGAQDAHEMVRHFSRLLFNSVHLAPPDKRNPGECEGVVSESLGGLQFDLAEIQLWGGKEDTLESRVPAETSEGRLLPSGFLDLGELMGSGVPLTLIDGPPPDEMLVSRVRLSVGKGTGRRTQAVWAVQETLGGTVKGVHAAAMLQWTVADIEADSLSIPLKNLGNNQTERVVGPLYPNNDGRSDKMSINLFVFHVPPLELPTVGNAPPALAPFVKHPHMAALFPLFGRSTEASEPEIRFAGKGPLLSSWSGPILPNKAFVGDEFRERAERFRTSDTGGSLSCEPPTAMVET